MKRIETLSSAANPTVKWLRGLAVKKHRDEEGLFVIEGARDVQTALTAGWGIHTLVAVDGALSHLPQMAASRTIHLTADLMSRVLNRDNAQSVFAVMHQRWAAASDAGRGLWLGLEDIRDPGNLGTIIRTADAVTCDGIILIGQTCDPFAPEAVRATMGSLPHVPLVRMTREGFKVWRQDYAGRVIGTHLSGARDYRDVDYAEGDVVILMGSESAGLSDEIAEICDVKVKIPMPGRAESLNLAVASALMLYEARRKKI